MNTTTSTAHFTTVSPLNNEVYCQRAYATAAELEFVLEQAKRAQLDWAETCFEQRTELCLAVIDYFEQHADEIALEICWQMGRPLQQCYGEIKGLAERGRYMISIAEQSLAAIEFPLESGQYRAIVREPLGLVMVMAPWNYPFLTAINSVIPAIMAGNTVLLKHSSQTPLCGERFAQAFTAAGAPAGLMTNIFLTHQQVEKVVIDQRIDFIAFTGSVAAGRQLQQVLAQRFVPIGLELGGKDPAYVAADADLSSAVAGLVDGAFYNSGQSCCGIERIYVHKSCYDDFIQQYVALVKQYQLGDPLDKNTDLGPLVRRSAAQNVQEQVIDAVAMGAENLVDPTQFNYHGEGAYLAPQVLADVNHQMALMREESFGPVVGIMPVDNDAAALQLMNDSDYGLTASIWTQSQDLALQMAKQLQTGTVFKNKCDYLDPALVWTGVKNTGLGHSLSQLGYRQLSRAKSLNFHA